MPHTESDHHHGVAAVARLDLVATPAAPATTSSSCATTTARDEEKEEDGFTFAAAAVAIPRLQDADCAFPDARVRAGPVYPVFGRPRWSLQKQQQQQGEEEEEDPAAAGTATVRLPLGRLLVDEQWCNYAPLASEQQPADDADAELDGVPAETYCLWYPGASPAGSRRASPAGCWKTGSTGSPVLRWRRQRRRSHSDGEDKFVFLGTSSDSISAGEEQGWMNHTHGSAARDGGESSSTAFLPCKRDLVELVASVVTCRRNCFLF